MACCLVLFRSEPHLQIAAPFWWEAEGPVKTFPQMHVCLKLFQSLTLVFEGNNLPEVLQR